MLAGVLCVISLVHVRYQFACSMMLYGSQIAAETVGLLIGGEKEIDGGLRGLNWCAEILTCFCVFAETSSFVRWSVRVLSIVVFAPCISLFLGTGQGW